MGDSASIHTHVLESNFKNLADKLRAGQPKSDPRKQVKKPQSLQGEASDILETPHNMTYQMIRANGGRMVKIKRLSPEDNESESKERRLIAIVDEEDETPYLLAAIDINIDPIRVGDSVQRKIKERRWPFGRILTVNDIQTEGKIEEYYVVKDDEAKKKAKPGAKKTKTEVLDMFLNSARELGETSARFIDSLKQAFRYDDGKSPLFARRVTKYVRQGGAKNSVGNITANVIEILSSRFTRKQLRSFKIGREMTCNFEKKLPVGAQDALQRGTIVSEDSQTSFNIRGPGDDNAENIEFKLSLSGREEIPNDGGTFQANAVVEVIEGTDQGKKQEFTISQQKESIEAFGEVGKAIHNYLHGG